ncbi:hypothetical protein [Streptomyces pseudovenezuelae]|uniref:hypothetical protein n=1 Tax=Streptomyces pseudovenezuelae TaxID=67350 RepID=UPI0036E8DC94
MRHTATARLATAAALLAVLTACGSNDEGSDGKASSSSSSPTASPSVDPATEYLTAAHTIPYANGQPTDTELTALPPKWCAGLDAGHSADWLFSSGGGGLYPNGMDWGTVKKNAYQLLVAGVQAYCPKHTDTVTEELRATGEY